VINPTPGEWKKVQGLDSHKKKHGDTKVQGEEENRGRKGISYDLTVRSSKKRLHLTGTGPPLCGTEIKEDGEEKPRETRQRKKCKKGLQNPTSSLKHPPDSPTDEDSMRMSEKDMSGRGGRIKSSHRVTQKRDGEKQPF